CMAWKDAASSKAVGDSPAPAANAASTNSPPTAARRSPNTAAAGVRSAAPSRGSRRCAMPDFHRIVRTKLGKLPLSEARVSEVNAELAHQLEDKYQEALTRGLPEARAMADALEQFGDWKKVGRAIFAAETGERVMWPGAGTMPRRASWMALTIAALLCLVPSF